jgi:hypothetical protein
MSTRTIEIDLYRDWIAHLRNELSTFGYDVTQFRTDEQVAHAFLNLLRRLVRPVPRAVLKSKSFSCPADLLPGLAEVERKIVAGDDLSPHLSRFLRSPSFNDPLLNDWGIHHIHLGTVVEDDGFISRTCPVLFARFDNAAAYLIDVLPHGSWALQSMVKTLHDNWPDSIKHFRLKGVISLERSLADGDIARLRKANVNTMVQLGEGIVYAPIGGGFATSSLSTDVVVRSNHCARRLRTMQQSVIDNIEAIATDARAKGIELPEKVQFGVEVKDDEIYAVEINCMLGVRLGRL